MDLPDGLPGGRHLRRLESGSETGLIGDLDRDGFVVLPGMFSPGQVAELIAGWEDLPRRHPEAAALLRGSGDIYAARHLLDLWPEVADVATPPPLSAVLRTILGPAYGVVRVLFFDKPPGGSWALPWHKDLTIAVKEHRPGESCFRKPTIKAGVPHVEAPLELLETMLTARIHLDDADDGNGALKVLVGSHRTGKDLRFAGLGQQLVCAKAGDVLLMRPLLVHCSGNAEPETDRHRRVLHLELAGSATLPDGYEWHSFRRGRQ